MFLRKLISRGDPKSHTFVRCLAVALLTLGIGASTLYAAWNTPTGNPPTPNVSTPINVSGTAQTKTGGLTLRSLTVTVSALLNGSFLAPGFSDSNNTGYYLNPEWVNRFYQINADRYCDQNGANCITNPGAASGLRMCRVCLNSNYGGTVCTGYSGPSSPGWKTSPATGIISSHGDHGNSHGSLQMGLECL